MADWSAVRCRFTPHDYRTAGGKWRSREIASGIIELPGLGGSIALDDIYPPGN